MNDVEKKIYVILLRYKYKLALLIAFYFVVQFFARLPYLNLIFSKDIIIMILSIFTIVIFEINTKKVMFLGILVLIISFFAEVIGRRELAEFLGNEIYIIFLIGVLKGIMQLEN